MRTTVNIPKETLLLCKKKAKETGKTLGEIISDALLEVYRERAKEKPVASYDLPVSGQGGLQSGIDLDNIVTLEDIMDNRS